MESDAKQSTKKQQICEAAARLFRDKGYSATSMRDLARAVNLKASSLYNHIQSKEEILQEICFRNARRFLEEMNRIEAMQAPAAEKVRELIRLHIAVATEDVTSVTAFNDEWRHLSEPQLSEFVALRRNYETRFRTIIEEGIHHGEFIPVHPTIALHTIFSAVRWLYDWFRPGRSVTMENLEEDITHLLMSGLER